MAGQLTLVHRLDNLPDMSVPTRGVRRMSEDDEEAVARLYFEAYEPGEACDTLEEARKDVRASFDGAYGEYWWEGSFVHEERGRLSAAVMTVRRAPWPDTPDGPFIIELFTDPSQRRRHLAHDLVELVLMEASASGEEKVGLRVLERNEAAVLLYRSLGFEEWSAGR